MGASRHWWREAAACSWRRGGCRPALGRGACAPWRGEPLADFAYRSFAQGENVRLGQARLAALEDRIDEQLALGEHASLVRELEALFLDGFEAGLVHVVHRLRSLAATRSSSS